MWALAKKREIRTAVTPEWKADVRAEISRRGPGAFSRLAEKLKCSTGKLADLLDDGERSPQTSPLVAKINAEFGWAVPLPPSTSRDSGELQHIFERLNEEQRRELLAAAEVISGVSGDDARQMLISMLRLTGSVQNDKNKS